MTVDDGHEVHNCVCRAADRLEDGNGVEER